MKITFYVACHKPFWVSVNQSYQRLQVGAAISDIKLPGLRDDTGESISEKNRHYCELTGLYWIWKNDKVSDAIGFCHYRRYFAFEEPGRGSLVGAREIIAGKDFAQYLDKMINPVRVEKYLETHEIVLPIPHCLPMGMEEYYREEHIAKDWDIMKDVLAKRYPEYSQAMAECSANRWFYSYNMFVMRRNLFDQYMSWLFSILSDVEEKVTISPDPYQARVFGFLSERLLNVYVRHNHLKVKEVPLLFIDEQQNMLRSKKKLLKHIVRDIKNKW